MLGLHLIDIIKKRPRVASLPTIDVTQFKLKFFSLSFFDHPVHYAYFVGDDASFD